MSTPFSDAYGTDPGYALRERLRALGTVTARSWPEFSAYRDNRIVKMSEYADHVGKNGIRLGGSGEFQCYTGHQAACGNRRSKRIWAWTRYVQGVEKKNSEMFRARGSPCEDSEACV